MKKLTSETITKVSGTAFTPLYSRAKGGYQIDISILKNFTFKLPVYDPNVLIRTKKFDEFVTNFLITKPNALIGNFGCGFCTRFWRVDNGQVLWMNFDLEETIKIRNTFFPKHERSKDIVCDFTKEKIKIKFDLIIAEGFFPYIEEKVALKHITSEAYFDLATKPVEGLTNWSYSGEELNGLKILSNDMLCDDEVNPIRQMWFIHAEPDNHDISI